MTIAIRRTIQVLFLGIFILAMVMNKAQFWMGFIFLSVVLAAFFGRFYCGFACPISTLMQPVAWLGRKLGIGWKQAPAVLKTGKPRLVLFGLFLVGLGYTIYTITQGRKFPLPLIIIPLGLLTALFINERSWHRYLCPWGVLFSLTARFSKRGIRMSGCSSCGVCKTSCPGDAITVQRKQPATVAPAHCLLCFECKAVCPGNAVAYRGQK